MVTKIKPISSTPAAMNERGTARGRNTAPLGVGAGNSTPKSWRQVPLSFPILLSTAISPSISNVLIMKIIHPWNSCKNPSAISMPQCSTITPMVPTRMLFISMVIGMLDRNSTALFQNLPL